MITFESSGIAPPADLRSIARALGGNVSGRQVLAPGPGHSPKDRSLSIKIDPAAPDGFITHSFAGDDPLQCKDHVREKIAMPPWQPTQKSNGQASTGRRATTAEYVYRLEDGTPYLRVKRTEDKKFYQQHWNGSAWADGAPKGPKIPYRLPELIQAEHETVLIVEGEKDADNLAALGLVATTNSCGAEKWTEDLNRYFEGRDVYILPDNDEPGERHVKQVLANLAGIAREIRIVHLPGLPEKGEISNWLEDGGTVDELARLMETAAKADPVSPEAVNKDLPPLTLTEWRDRELPPPEFIMGQWSTTTTRCLLTAATGLGKTNFGLALGMRVASGVDFLHWQGWRKTRVLYIDGEMSRRLLRRRVLDEAQRFGTSPETFLALSHEDIDGFKPLNTAGGQAWMNGLIEKIGRP